MSPILLILKQITLTKFFPFIFVGFQDIAAEAGGGWGGEGGGAGNVLTSRNFFCLLLLESLKAGSATAIFGVLIKFDFMANFLADVVIQEVPAFKSVQRDIFVAFLSLFYVFISVAAKAVTTEISYFGAILLKKNVLQAICNERLGGGSKI